jgi:hypothetical protein
LPNILSSRPVLVAFVKNTVHRAAPIDKGKARLSGEGRERRGSRKFAAIGGIPRRFEAGSFNGPPTAQSTAIIVACERRKLVSIICAPVQRSARAEIKAKAAPAAAAARIAAAITNAGDRQDPPEAPATMAAAKVPTEACPSPPKLKAPALKAMQAPRAQRRREAEDSSKARKGYQLESGPRKKALRACLGSELAMKA